MKKYRAQLDKVCEKKLVLSEVWEEVGNPLEQSKFRITLTHKALY